MKPEERDADIRFSVLIPVYNVERYLKECLESVLQQSKSVYEVILVDDGSTDNSGEICDEYSRKYSFIKSFHKENQGQLATRWYASNMATGNWLVFLDSDDTLKENAIEILYKKIEEFSPDCIIYGLDRVQEGQVINYYKPEISGERLINDRGVLYELVFTHSALNSMCRKAVRAELLSKDTNYEEYYHIRLAEDLLQSIEIYKKGSRFLFLPVSLYNYRYNESSTTNTIKIQNYKIDFTVRENVISFLRRENVFSSIQWESYYRYSLEVFIDQVKTILTFKASSEKIRELLDKIRNSKYYQDYIMKIKKDNAPIIDRIILMSLRERHYTTMIIFNKLYNARKRFT